jgi:protein-tyrosine phosphatase
LDQPSPATVLFLCTGNYYRSRHAEAVFNHLATTANLSWRATSRGLALEFGVNNVGPIARATLNRLRLLGIDHGPYLREPIRVEEADFAAARLVVALKESEHRPLMNQRHPEWADRIEYWTVDDIDFATPAVALPTIEAHVQALVARLRGALASIPAGNSLRLP